MKSNLLTRPRTAVSSAAMVLLFSTGNALADFLPNSPEECATITPWAASDKVYPPGSCVGYGKYVWTVDEDAPAIQAPSNHRSSPWYRIGDYVAPDALPALIVGATRDARPQPTVYVVKPKAAWQASTLQFAELPKSVPQSRFKHVSRPGVEGEYTRINVLASSGGRLGWVWLRAQRNTSGTGLEGVRVPIDATGGEAGAGAMVVWYDPQDNLHLKPGQRYVTRSHQRTNIQVVGADLPGMPALDTFPIGVDIVHRLPGSQFGSPEMDVTEPARTLHAAPSVRQFGATYERDSVYQRNFKVADIAGAIGTRNRLTYLNYGYASLGKGQDGLLRCSYDDDAAGRNNAFTDYSRTFAAPDAVDRRADDRYTRVRGNFYQIQKLQWTRGTAPLISVGGPGKHADLAEAARTEEGRRALAQSCVEVYIKGDLPWGQSSTGGWGAGKGVFQGINIEWLSPRAGASIDWNDYLALTRAFRDALGETDTKRKLTATINAAESVPDARLGHLIAGELNWVNVQAYDFTGASDGKTGHASARVVPATSPWAEQDGMSHRSLTGLIARMRDIGVPAAKQVYGMPMHGHGWTGVQAGNANGLAMNGTPVPEAQGGSVRSYRDIVRMAGYRDVTDREAGAAYRFNGSTFWSVDTPETVRAKVELIDAAGNLGGVFASDISGDSADKSLLKVMAPGR